jgi:hypothetical protein
MEVIMKRNLNEVLFLKMKTEERNIHIGLDLWIKAGTPILAALDGTLHSFNFNAGLEIMVQLLYWNTTSKTKLLYLYGHLSLDSLEDLTLGTVYKRPTNRYIRRFSS